MAEEGKDIFGVGVAQDALEESRLSVVALPDEYELGWVETRVQSVESEQEMISP